MSFLGGLFSGEKPHKCSLCDFRCRDESYLSKHMLTHLDEKNFMCAECGYITRWKHYLTVHMRKHAGDLRYKTTLELQFYLTFVVGAEGSAKMQTLTSLCLIKTTVCVYIFL